MKVAYGEIKRLPNLISLFRLLLAVPLFLIVQEANGDEKRYAAFGLALFAAFTDILDGYIARKRNEVSEFGKIIDPLADKIAVGGLVLKLFLLGEMPLYYFIIILGRDLLIFLGGIFIAGKIGKVLPSNILGKITIVNIGIVLLFMILNIDRTTILFKGIYFLSIILIFVSLIGYYIRGIEFLKRKKYEPV